MKLRITHIIVMKSVCRWVMISGSAMSNAKPWTAASRVPIVVTDRAVHSYPCQFSLSSFMFESQLSICLMRFDDTFIPFFNVSYLLVDLDSECEWIHLIGGLWARELFWERQYCCKTMGY